ncbi:universal stress protein [Nocardioides sp. zg-536]|uniref:Universal stress protein n=1 Tax=Nocardioides faecalis TaxID=2803858 RepID=A0A939BSV3_9ACTN|nr:universal stress protein [Nocardioides faecalis]MBM9460014.1 universal stress protein [Nocardioides faecalis]MBS4753118.1 universal stress protein [Nocardioides faecalis]QVI58765.1 universal stress protein [Nocardioides faecalis]
MHVIVATDGSRQSLQAARTFKSFADPHRISDVSVLAVIRPLSSVAFADEISGSSAKVTGPEHSFRAEAEAAVRKVAEEFDGWGPALHRRIRSGSPANEIIKAAKQLDAGLVVVAAGGRGLSESVLIGSTAQRVQNYAPCPVLVVRPKPRKPAHLKK